MPRKDVSLDPLLDPDTVAVVGASPDSWYSSQLMDNLLEYGFEGAVYPVNPSRDEAWDRTCYDDLLAVPGDVNLAVVSVPREYVVETVEQAGRRGIPAALVISAGFEEADERGSELESELAAVADEHDVRIAGPNCIGLANALTGTVLTSTCSRRPDPGSIGLVSQSGALAFTTFFERAADEDISFAYIVSTGNEVDLSVTDYVEYIAEQPDVDVVCAYVEGIEAPREFMQVADEATRAGTPVLVVKIGRSEVADAATLSHTGSLTGSDAAWSAAFEQTGVERVSDIPDLLAKAGAHAAFDAPPSDRICVASTSGGLASLLADLAAKRDLSLPAIEGETERRLLDIDDLLTFGEINNPADIRGYGADVLPEIAEILFADDSFDLYVFAIGLSAVDDRAADIASDLLTVQEMADSPALFLWTGRKEADDDGDGEDRLPYERVRSEVPLYYDPAKCLDGARSLVEAGEAASRSSLPRSTLEASADGASVPALPSDRILTWSETASLLDAFDVEVVETRVASSAAEAANHAASLGFPVVLKVDSVDVAHRTDADAVRVGLDGEHAVREAYESIVENVRERHPAADVNGVLVQPEVPDGVEALVGVSPEPGFGSVVTVGPGGTRVELLDDAEIRVPPLCEADARSAIEATALGDLLAGHRDRPERDREALVELVRRVGDLAAATGDVAELDLNPVVVHEDGVSVVDALIRTESD